MPQLNRVHVSFSCAKIGRVFVVLTLLVSIGAHWAVLRSVAWTQMLVERTQQGSFSKAVKTTFDGAHPCEMCKRIEHQQKEEQRHESGQTIQKVKLDVALATNAITIAPPSFPQDYPALSRRASARTEQPPSPPPKTA